MIVRGGDRCVFLCQISLHLAIVTVMATSQPSAVRDDGYTDQNQESTGIPFATEMATSQPSTVTDDGNTDQNQESTGIPFATEMVTSHSGTVTDDGYTDQNQESTEIPFATGMAISHPSTVAYGGLADQNQECTEIPLATRMATSQPSTVTDDGYTDQNQESTGIPLATGMATSHPSTGTDDGYTGQNQESIEIPLATRTSSEEMKGCYINCQNASLTLFPEDLPSCTVYLNLADNDVKSISDEEVLQLPMLEKLILTNNPLNCTCDLMWLNILMRKRDNLTVVDAVCASPEIVKNMSLEEVRNELGCPEFLWYGDDDLYFFTDGDNSTDWEGANSECNNTAKQLGLTGHLAIIQEWEVLESITAHIKMFTEGQNKSNYWIGCNDSYEEGIFRWIDNAAVNCSLWKERLPDNKPCKNDKPKSQDCCQLWYKGNNIILDDVCCHEENAAVCQVENTNISRVYQTDYPRLCNIPTASVSTVTKIQTPESSTKVDTNIYFVSDTLTTEDKSIEITSPSSKETEEESTNAMAEPEHRTTALTSPSLETTVGKRTTPTKSTEHTSIEIASPSPKTTIGEGSSPKSGTEQKKIAMTSTLSKTAVGNRTYPTTAIEHTSIKITNAPSETIIEEATNPKTAMTTIVTERNHNPSPPTENDVRRSQLENLANSTIPPGQTLRVTEMVSNLTSRADTFEESDVSLSVDIVGNILQSQENGTEVAVAHGVLQTVDNLLSVDNDVLLASQGSHNSATRLLQSVERLSQLIDFNGARVTIETPNILLTVAEVNVTEFQGLSFGVPTLRQSKTFKGYSDSTEDTKTSIELPVSLFENVSDSEKSRVGRAQFLAYRSNTFFKAVDNRTLPGFSPVIAASIGDLTITNLQEPVKIRLAKNASYSNANESCVFWDYNLNGGSGAWSGKGCVLSSENEDNANVLCQCDHLTNFALLVDIYNEGMNIDSSNEKALSIISYIGCIVSLLALAVTLVTLIAYKKTKDKATKILLNLCFALFMAMTMFLIGSFATDFAPIIPELCTTVAVLLHYFLLSVMAWMALEAALLYLLLVKVFKTYIKSFMLKFCLVGWGVPLIVVTITLAINLNNYGYNNTVCWLSRYPFYGAFLAPLSLVLIFNTVIYSLVIYQICGLNSKAMTANERYSYLAQLRAAIGLMVLLGLTWVFAFFAVGQASLLFNYLFAIFNSLQGLFIFVFHCAMKTEVKAGWKKTFCRCMVVRHRAAGDTDAWTSSSNGLKYQISNTEDIEIKLDSSTASVEQMDRDNEQTMSTFKGLTP